MSALVGFIIVAVAFLTVAGVLYLVMQEKHEHDEHYIPGQTPEMRANAEHSAESNR